MTASSSAAMTSQHTGANYHSSHHGRGSNNNQSSLDYHDFMEDAQMAAYKTIMSRISPPSPSKSEDSVDDIY
jgi:hypothetical protein